jgi:Ca2+-binding RTX toxin-like protein
MAVSQSRDLLSNADADLADDIVSAGNGNGAVDFRAAPHQVGITADVQAVAPDLRAITPNLDGSTFSFQVKNVGTDTADASIAGIYLSTDNHLTTADTRIGTVATPSLAVDAADSESVTLTLPSALTAGTYYIGAIADYKNTVSEDNETNNASGVTAIVLGNSANNTLTGTTGDDHIFALQRDDKIVMAGNLTASDQIDGGTGTDTVTLTGDYSAGLTFAASTMVNVEALNLGAGFNYSLTTDDGTVAAGQSLAVDGSALSASKTLTFNGAAESDGSFNLTGGAGDDALTGGAQNDVFTPGAGNDTVNGRAGNDKIVMAANLTAADQINGGLDTDTVTLTGDYSAGLTFAATTMVNVETLKLGAGFNYNLTTDDATVGSGQTLTVDGSSLKAANALTFDGSAETNGAFIIKGGDGNDTVTAGGGDDVITTGDGSDTVVMGANLTAADKITGGAGADTVLLTGAYGAGLTFSATTMVGVETLNLGAGFNYNLTIDDATVTKGKTLTVDASALSAAKTLTFNGAAETNGNLNIIGGAGDDAVAMGAHLTSDDKINGGAGTDTVNLSGNYGAGVAFTANTLVNVENLNLGAGFNYRLITKDATVASGQTLTVDGSALGAANALTFNGSAETDGSFVLKGGAGSDSLTGGDGNDTITISTGNDVVNGRAGDDTIVVGANLTAADQINGGGGNDTVTLAGDYSAGVTFTGNTIASVENLILAAGFSYKFTTNDATLSAGQSMTVDASALAASNTLNFNGAAETNGIFIIKGGAGGDTVAMGANLTSADQVDGGAGSDTVTLAGDYSAGVTFAANTLVNVETLKLTAGNNYKLTTNDATVASGQTMTVDASALGAANSLNFNGAAETNGTFNITGGAGNDTMALGARLTAASLINGGAGTDTVKLAGDYSAGLTFSATTMTNVETLNLGAGFNYNLTTNDATVATGKALAVDASALASGNALTFNGAAETNGTFSVSGGAGNDVVTGGSGNDTFTPGAGNDTVTAGAGNDTIVMGANLTASDAIDGGANTDTVTLAGNYSGGVTFGATTMVNVENLTLGAGFNYNLTTNDATVASGLTLTVDASALAAANSLTFNGAAETNGFFVVKGGAGNDTIAMGAGLVATDKIDGGAGADTVTLSGTYSAFTFGATTMVNVENLTLGAGFNYNLTTNNATVGTAQTLTVDGSALGSGNTLTFNGAAETSSGYTVKGGAGNDSLTTGAGNDTVTANAGNDIVKTGVGTDTIVMGANLTAADQIDGGTGTDAVTLSGNYSGGVTFAANTMVNVETLTLGTGFSYSLTTNDATVASSQTLTVDGSALASGNTLTFNASAETSSAYNITGGAGNDVVTGGAGNDTVTTGTGNDTVNTGVGNDTIAMGANLTAADQIDGSTGSDTVTLAGNYSGGVTFGATTMVNVEALTLGAGFSYNLTTNDATVASGQLLSVNGSALASGSALTFNGAAETNGTFNVTGGAGNDSLTGGAGADTFTSGAGSDTIKGNAGSDTIAFGANLTAADQIDGGADSDTVTLTGDYSAGLTFGATTMVNVENLTLATGTAYNFTTDDATVASGQNLNVVGSGATTLTFNGAAETNGSFSITTGSGNDALTGGAGADTFTSGSGNDTLKGNAGADTFAMAANLTAADQIDGGADSDTVTLTGNYSGLTFGATTMVNVENLNLGASSTYNLTTNDATVASGQTLTVSASSTFGLTFNGAAETNGSFNITSGTGNDVLTGGAGADTFNPGSGTDTISGGAGNDTITMTRYMTAADVIDGGANSDTVSLAGDYSAGITFGATTMINVETLSLTAGTGGSGPFQYKLTTNDATVASGQTLTVDGSALGSTNIVTFNGSAETNGTFNITTGAAADTLTGGAGSDVLNSGSGIDTITTGTGNDTVNAGAGADTIVLGANLTASDVIDGGADSDTVTLTGDYSAGITFGATTMTNVESMTLGTGFSYKFTTNDATVASGQTLTIDGSALASGNTLTWTGSAETNGTFNITGGAGNDVMVGGSGIDTLSGGAGNDTITGGAGADILSGSTGSDKFVYTAVSNSASTNYDTISDIDFSADTIDITGSVTGIDTAVTTGALNTASFDTDMATALSGKLGASHAVLFTADSGTLSGQTFLIVDSNGSASYTANSDLVINVTGWTGTLATGDFV